MRPLGRLTSALAALSAWLLFAIGAMLTYEVTARYFFNAPTVWAEELSRLFLIWAVFLASAALLRSGEHIRVTVLVDLAPAWAQQVARVFALTFVAIVSGFVAWHGIPIAADSFAVGRTTGSMLDIPSWWLQAAIPVGFALLAVQALVLALGVLLFGETPEEGRVEL